MINNLIEKDKVWNRIKKYIYTFIFLMLFLIILLLILLCLNILTFLKISKPELALPQVT